MEMVYGMINFSLLTSSFILAFNKPEIWQFILNIQGGSYLFFIFIFLLSLLPFSGKANRDKQKKNFTNSCLMKIFNICCIESWFYICTC